jgi:hypothetical protein
MTQTIIEYNAAAHNHTHFTNKNPSNTTPTVVFPPTRRLQRARYRITSIATHDIATEKEPIVREPRRSVLNR